MKNILRVAAMLVMVFVVASCTSAQSKQKNIEVYGSSECHHCVDLKHALDSAAITYTFFDVVEHIEYHQVMLDKAKNGGLSTRFGYPLVDIEGDVIGGATFADVKKILEKTEK